MIEVRKNNKSIQVYIIALFLTISLCIIMFLMYKYYVEGEKNLPFNITKQIVISSASTENFERNEDVYEADIIQKNDIFIGIEKNPNYKKEDAIKEVLFNNFKVLEPGKIGKVETYRTSEDETFKYIEKYLAIDEIKYVGAKDTNLKEEQMTIGNQGGLLEISIILNDLGRFTYTENENIESDGRLLKKLNLKTEDIKTKISFDVVIKLVSGNIFKTTITLDLPISDIANEGVSTVENTNLDKLVFKRI